MGLRDIQIEKTEDEEFIGAIGRLGLGTGETISSVALLGEIDMETEEAPGSPVHTGNALKGTIESDGITFTEGSGPDIGKVLTGGTLGKRYKLSMLATTSLGRKLAGNIILKII